MKIKETALGKYLNEIDKGKILVGRELYQELLNLKQEQRRVRSWYSFSRSLKVPFEIYQCHLTS